MSVQCWHLTAPSSNASWTDINQVDMLPWRKRHREIQGERGGGRGELCPRQGGFTHPYPPPSPELNRQDRTRKGSNYTGKGVMYACVCMRWIFFDILTDVMSKVRLGRLAMPFSISSKTDRMRWWTITCCSFLALCSQENFFFYVCNSGFEPNVWILA